MSDHLAAGNPADIRHRPGPNQVPALAYGLLHAAFLLLPLASVLSVLILLGLGAYFLWRRTRVEVAIPFKSWWLLMAAVGLSCLTSVTPAFSAIAVVLFGSYFTVMWVVGLMLDTPDRIWALCRNIFWTTVVCAIVGIGLSFSHTYWVYLSGPIELRLGTPDHRAASVFFHPNIFSAYLLMVSGLGLMLLLRHRGRARWSLAFGMALLLFAQVLTASRSGWIGTLVMFGLIGLLVDRRVVVAVVGGAMASLVALWSMILPRLHTLVQLDFLSNLHRVMVWKSAARMILARPLTGWGPGTWPVVYPKFEDPLILEKMPHAHSMYLMIGAEFGLIVLAVLLGVFLSLVVKTIRETRGTSWYRHVVIMGCTILGYLVVGMFDFIFTEGRNSILFFSVLGILVAMRRFRPRPHREIRRVLFISNGFGEDRIAASIARRWEAVDCELWAMPIVGEGRGYRQAHATVVGPTQVMPSGGFILRSPRALWQDLAHGLVALSVRQILAIRAMREEIDLVVAVGDVVPLYFAWLSAAPFVFVGCAKSDYYLGGRFGSYGLLERWFIHHPRCRAIFARDPVTARNLAERGYRAQDLGNPMMDDLEAHGRALPAVPGERRIGLLPGSRDEAYDNLKILLECCVAVVRRAPESAPVGFYAAIAESLDLERLEAVAQAVGWAMDAPGETLVGPHGISVRLVRGQFGTWIRSIEAVIGLAGTANEQCVGMGLPVVTFAGHGPQFNAHFAEAQTRLLGESVSMVEARPEAVAQELWAILGDPDRLELIRRNGRERMGEPGAARRIAQHSARCLAPVEELERLVNAS